MDKRFIKFADLPPNPLSDDDLTNYKNLGFNVCLLTEDYVNMVNGRKLSDDYKKAITNISKAGLDVWIRNMYNDADYFECDSYKTSSNYGSLYEMEARRITTEFGKFPCVTGFYMADEAYMYTLPKEIPVSWMNKEGYLFASFDKLIKLVEWKNKYYPDKFWHMNHVPSQSWDHYLPKNGEVFGYEDFLAEYNEIILKGLNDCNRSICIDNYPLIGEDYIEKDYLFDLMTASNLTRAYNKDAKDMDKATFGICIQTFHAYEMVGRRHRDIVSPEEITFQLYVGMALGGRLFEYFCYHSYEKFAGILDHKGEKRIYDLVKTANERAFGFEEILYEFDYLGAFAISGEKYTENTAAFILAKDLFFADNNISMNPDCDTLVGCFDKDGQKGYMLVNYTDPIRNHCSNVVVKLNYFEELHIYQDNTSVTVDTETGEFEISLKAGNAAFLYTESKNVIE